MAPIYLAGLYVFLYIIEGGSAVPATVDTLPVVDSLLQQEMEYAQQHQRVAQGDLRRYNPNYLTDYEAYLCGLDRVTLQRIRQYRATGDKFDSAKEFLEVTGLPPGSQDSILARLYFPSDKSSGKASTRSRHNRIDLNRADEIQLQELRGIGRVRAARIVKFRERLGGFRDVNQLRDVYGITEDLADQLIQSNLTCSPSSDTTRLDLMRSSPSELRGFPYFRESHVEKIIRFRSSAGEPLEPVDFKFLFDFSDEKFHRVALYLR